MTNNKQFFKNYRHCNEEHFTCIWGGGVITLKHKIYTLNWKLILHISVQMHVKMEIIFWMTFPIPPQDIFKELYSVLYIHTYICICVYGFFTIFTEKLYSVKLLQALYVKSNFSVTYWKFCRAKKSGFWKLC